MSRKQQKQTQRQQKQQKQKQQKQRQSKGKSKSNKSKSSKSKGKGKSSKSKSRKQQRQKQQKQKQKAAKAKGKAKKIIPKIKKNNSQKNTPPFSTCMFCSLFPDIRHKLRRIPLSPFNSLNLQIWGTKHLYMSLRVCCWLTQWTTHWQYSLHVILISKHPSWSRQTKQTCQKSTDWPNIPESKGC